ncbi:MAG: hypothetical protein ACLFSM_01665 [Thermoplasmata archaeon]
MNGEFADITVLNEDPVIRFLISIFPAVIGAVLLYLLGSDIYMPVSKVFIAFYFALGVGWILSPAIALASGIHPVWVILILVFISSESSLIVSANYPLLEKVPLLGTYMKRLRSRAMDVIEKKKIIKKVEYLGIFWLMFLPVYGFGPNVMTLVGRLLGLEWKRVWAVITFSAAVRFSLVTVLLYIGYLSI